MTAVPMPIRGERAAPQFSSSKPREVGRYFEDLEYLMARADIKTDKEKKTQVLRYVDYETEQLWKTFSEYSDNNQTYEKLRDAILEHYPDSAGDFVYSLRDMDSLIGERQRIGVATSHELSEYHLQFKAITRWLINKQQLGDLEQRRAYTRAFQPQFLAAIMNRLQLKDPDHHPSIPYNIEDVFQAARFILQGASTGGYSIPTTVIAATSNQSPANEIVKKENLGAMLQELTKTIIEAFNNSQSRSNGQNTRSYNNSNQQVDCNYCGGPHYIIQCKEVDKDIEAGKVRRNHDGKVILSTGAFVPRDIQGRYLRDRVNEWHKRNPGQIAVATLINTIDMQIVNGNNCATMPTSNFQLSTEDRIVTLEAELYNLRARKAAFVPTVRTRGQKAKEVGTDKEDAAGVAAARARLRATVQEEEEGTREKEG